MMNNFTHLVEVDEKTRTLRIYRIFEDGKKQLYTSVELPTNSGTERDDAISQFARQLGENLLMDSPVARKLLQL